jgi:methylated-DNA-[protein]-cysteine S-methyltransferase
VRYSYSFSSPVGPLSLIADNVGLREVRFAETTTPLDPEPPTPLLARAAEELTEYFNGTRHAFDLPLAPEGTPFQQRVWAELRNIPYGQTTTYSTIARRLGDALAVRAVGRANGQNPLAIVVPCHRVIGTGGKLTGFNGGLERKQWLLQMEGQQAGQQALFTAPAIAAAAV